MNQLSDIPPWEGFPWTAVVAIFAAAQLSLLPILDTPLTVSLYSFAIAIPCLIGDFYVAGADKLELPLPAVKKQSFVQLMLLGNHAMFVGICGLFWHHSVAVACVFILFSGINFFFGFRWVNANHRILKSLSGSEQERE